MPSEPLLTRAMGKTPATASGRVNQDTQEQRTVHPERKQNKPPLVGRTGHGDPSRGGDGWESRVRRHLTPPPHRLVCPGCGRAGIRGGVRCNSGGARTTYGEPELRDRATSTQITKNNILCTEDMSIMDGTAECSAGNSGIAWGEGPASHQSSPTGVSAPAPRTPVGNTFHTSLGVIVDACTWGRRGDAVVAEMVDGGRATRNENNAPYCSGGENMQVLYFHGKSRSRQRYVRRVRMKSTPFLSTVSAHFGTPNSSEKKEANLACTR